MGIGAFICAILGPFLYAITGAFICAILGAFICAIIGAFICAIIGAFICAIIGAFIYAIIGAFICATQHNLLRSQGSISAQQVLQFNSNTSCHVRKLGFHLGSHLRRSDLVLQGILLLLCRALECCDVVTMTIQ